MKSLKVLGIILSIALAVSVLAPITAGAAETLTVTAENITVKAGESFEITLNVTSNPGFAAFLITPKAPEGFTFEGYKNGSIMKDLDVGKNMFWSSAEDSNATGTLVTVTYSVDSSVAAGEYTVEFVKRECFNENFNAVSVKIDKVKVTVEAVETEAPVVTETTEATEVTEATEATETTEAVETTEATEEQTTPPVSGGSSSGGNSGGGSSSGGNVSGGEVTPEETTIEPVESETEITEETTLEATDTEAVTELVTESNTDAETDSDETTDSAITTETENVADSDPAESEATESVTSFETETDTQSDIFTEEPTETAFATETSVEDESTTESNADEIVIEVKVSGCKSTFGGILPMIISLTAVCFSVKKQKNRE